MLLQIMLNPKNNKKNMKTKKSTKVRVTRTGRRLCIALALSFGFSFLTSCNVTRRVSTESSYYQKGDTACTIIVKTIESYDATKKVY